MLTTDNRKDHWNIRWVCAGYGNFSAQSSSGLPSHKWCQLHKGNFMPKPTLNLIVQTIHLVFFGEAVLKPEACLKNWNVSGCKNLCQNVPKRSGVRHRRCWGLTKESDVCVLPTCGGRNRWRSYSKLGIAGVSNVMLTCLDYFDLPRFLWVT